MPDDSDYYITYGFGYAKYEHESLGIVSELDVFVPNKDKVKINILKLKNKNPEKKRLKLYYYIKPVLGEEETKTNGMIQVEKMKNQNIILAKNIYAQTEDTHITYLAASEEVSSYTGNKNGFIGAGTLQNPEGIRKVRLDNESGLGENSCIALEISIEIPAYEEKEVAFILGQEDDILDVKTKAYQYSNLSNCKEAYSGIKKYWEELLNKVQVKTPIESMNILLNGWTIYQTIVSRLWARTGYYQSGGAYGFRDQLQDVLALKYIDIKMVREQIIKHAAHQFVEGDVEHWWHEDTKWGIRTRFSDDLLWLPYLVYEYIDYTKDEAILDTIIPYVEGEELQPDENEKYDLHEKSTICGSLYEHCIKAIERSLQFLPNELPKIGSGDWNDGFSNVGPKGKGTSIWLGFFLYDILTKFIKICNTKADFEKAALYEERKENLRKVLNTVGWDGRWYKRAYTDEAEVIGSIESEEARIDSISQSWSVLSDAADNDKKYISMESLETHLVDRENGIIKLLDPPFEKSSLEPGYIKAYLPGVRENGGQYTHAAIWAIIANCKLGFGDKAEEFFRIINPIEHARTKEAAKKYKVEPYVCAADVYGTGNLARKRRMDMVYRFQQLDL